MSLLERYAKRTYETRGLLHQRNLYILRNYLNTSSEDDIYNEIWEINDVALLRTLWEAGLKKRLQERVLQRYTHLTGRREF